MLAESSQALLSDEDALAQALAASRLEAESAEGRTSAISSALPLSDLAAEYAGGLHADLYQAKSRFLEKRYGAFRRVRGDGNCFYRAFYVSWMERLIGLSAVEQREVWDRLMPSRSAALEPHLPAALGISLVGLGRDVAERTRLLCTVGEGDAEARLLSVTSERAAATDSRPQTR